jgi:hypothetical protein
MPGTSGYVSLGSAFNVASADTTGNNSGNWTNEFDPSTLPKVSTFEMYHAVVTGVEPGAAASIWIGSRQWGFTNPVSGSEWDPAQPMLLNPGQSIFFYWSDPVSDDTPPSVTLWFRYDPDLPGNESAS